MRVFFLLFIMFSSLFAFDSVSATEERHLVELDESPDAFIEKLDRYHPYIHVLNTFDTLLQAVAIEGKPHQIERVLEEQAVKRVFPVVDYTASYQLADTELISDSYLDLELGYTGKGIKVGIVDTGIDYTHPDLKGNYKGGYDLFDLDDDPMETQPEEGMPTLHGTHVSGIVGANGTFKGVAPDVDLYAYRALGPGGIGTNLHVIAALEQAVKDGMDIINLSLGNTINGPDWPTSTAVNRAVEKGVSVVVANGNAGPEDWTVGSPATAEQAISVGASTKSYTKPELELLKNHQRIELLELPNAKSWDLTRDYRLTTDPNDASEHILLVDPTEQNFLETLEKIKPSGLLIEHKPDESIEALLHLQTPFPVALISEESAESLRQDEGLWLRTHHNEIDNEVASFSSRGPVTASWAIKPDIIAPGYNILSTVPDGYQALNGTSMAAPYVTGVLAILKEANPDYTPEQLKAALLTGASPLKTHAPIEQGAGEINAEASLETDLLIENAHLSFGIKNEHNEEQTHILKVTNVSDQPIPFEIKRPRTQIGKRWDIPKRVIISPNETIELPIRLTVTQPKSADDSYQGYLTTETDNKNYQLPYLWLNQIDDLSFIRGIEFEPSIQDPMTYHFSLQLSEPVETLVIDALDPQTLQHQATLYHQEKVDAGLYQDSCQLPDDGSYLINVTVVKNQKQESHQFMLEKIKDKN
ncbi:minor extracellular serine protease Vpr [Pelagirhabdus alkalitolerans]|uniref:Minor extracellular serine protease Vpr n=1 Tax=Pelagirhabdus alkalitolerans TaxID=1612202 RepID=A0A1G6GHE2_9BACI|nr:S8 family serine peptidase [Pelagirhabdus alkalitolerans]SDB81428.1 minor extracellular serine protease Vpr [Pelagirhabdus alkalitolerans]